MRTIETTLYEFGELNQEAKQTAVKLLREQAAECGSDADWEDANESIKAIEKMAGIKCDIQFSSQGHYCRHYRLAYESYPSDEEEREMWDGLMDNLRKYEGGVWSDDMLRDILLEYEYDEHRGYAGSVAWAIVEFCDKVYLNTCDYYDDDYVSEWIEGNNFEFREDGRLYHE